MTTFDWCELEEEFRQATTVPGMEAGQPDWWQAWHRHVAERAGPKWFYAPEDADRFAATWPALTARWRTAAAALVADLTHVGFRPCRLENGDIDWGANPDKTMSWAGFHYWSWANGLIRGYALTGDERYVLETAGHIRSYFEQIDTYEPEPWDGYRGNRDPSAFRDFITFNDLSAGIKMVTFAEAAMVFARSAEWGPDDLRRATLLMLRLARRLFETYRDTASPVDFLKTRNFLTSGASGLGTVAAVFPECAWSADWAILARHILETHLMELFYPDGGHRELCTQYHKTGIRDIMFIEQVLRAQGKPYFTVVEPYRTKLLLTVKWLTSILMPDGSTAVLNSAAASNDWLVFALVVNRHLRDAEVAWHVNRRFSRSYVPRQKAVPPLCVRILGPEDKPDPTIPAAAPARMSTLFPDTGVAVLRDGWDASANVMVIDFGRPEGGHAYPARAGFSLYLRGRPAAMSPGSPHSYTDPAYRGWMHTTLSQNTVLLDDVSQAEWESAPRRRVHGEITRWEETGDSVLVQGRHPGYLLDLGVLHTRTVRMLPGCLFLVHDVLDATAAVTPHVAKWSIHCPEPMTEQENSAALAAGLMRVAPAWPDRIARIETGSEGKAVFPEEDGDTGLDLNRRINCIRWCSPLEPGGVLEFLMLIQPDEAPVRILDTAATDRRRTVRIEMDGATKRIIL
ncbi:alginate lyase family protein [Verrucomicrobiota bacterium]